MKKISETTSGSIATVSVPFTKTIKRGGNLLSGKKTNKKFANSVVKEQKIEEEDLIISPSIKSRNIDLKSKDHEVSMALNELERCGKASGKLHEYISNISEEHGLPGWVSKKITIACDYLESVSNYMESNTKSLESQNIFYDADKPAQPWSAIEKIHGHKPMTENHNLAFDIRSDKMWPHYIYENKDYNNSQSFNNWVSSYEPNEPKVNQDCVIALVIHTGDNIEIIYGISKYLGQDDTHYFLLTNNKKHSYSKKNQLVFKDSKDFEQFLTTLTLKFDDIKVNIDKKQVMESKMKYTKVFESIMDDKMKTLFDNIFEEFVDYDPDDENVENIKRATHAFNKISMLSISPVKTDNYYTFTIEITDSIKLINGPVVASFLGKQGGNYILSNDFTTTNTYSVPGYRTNDNNDGIIGTLFFKDKKKYSIMQHYLKSKFNFDMPNPVLNQPNVKEDVSTTPGGVGGSTKMILEKDKTSKPKIRKYTKERPDGSTMVRYEVLDYRGHRASGQGSEGFDDIENAKQFLRANREKLSEPTDLDEAKLSKDSKYAIGMAAAKKQAGYGSKPAQNLPKKVIKKAHKIAKEI